MFEIKIKYKISEDVYNDRQLILNRLVVKLNILKMNTVTIVDNDTLVFKNDFFRKSNSWHVMSPINKGEFKFIPTGRKHILIYRFPLPSFLYIFIIISLVILLIFHNIWGCAFFLAIGVFGVINVFYSQRNYFGKLIFGESFPYPY